MITPVLVGIGIYYFAAPLSITGFVRNQLPDGLWAYAFASCLLITWQRHIHIAWMLVMAVLFIALELLQYWGILPGTADMADIVVYLLSAVAAIFTNPFFKLKMIQHEQG